MPYKVTGKIVYKFHLGRWVVEKIHKTHAQALAHFRALMVNVMKKEGRK